MAIQLRGPDGQNLRKWHARKIGKPYAADGILGINLYSPVVERGLEDSAYSSVTLRDTAIALILDYYGKAPGTLVNLGPHAVHFPTRSLSNPILQFVVPEIDVEDANDLAINNLNLVGDEILIDIRKITPFITYVGTAFKVYQQQLKFFNGSITPSINFLDLLDKLKLFFENVKDFAVFNGYELSKYKSINIVIDKSNYQVTGAYLVDSQLKQYFLVKGTKYYFSTLKQGTNKYVNEIVTNFYSILLGKQSKINWTQFIHNFLPDSGIVVDYYGKPSTETEADKIAKEILSKAAFGPLAVTTADATGIRQNIGRTDVQEKAFKEAKKDLQKSQLSLQKRIEIIVNEIQEVGNEANKVAIILNKYNVTTLIEAALECLLFKGGFNGSVPDFIPGISPFDPAPPKISIKFPPIEFKFPIISINKELQVTVRESIKRALLGAVMSIIQTIADIIKELCLSEPNENDVQSTPAQDVVGAPDGEDSPLYQCYADFGFDPPAHASFGALPTLPQTSGDTLESFLIALSPLITARELCDLFNGIAAGQIFQVINNLIDNQWPEIRPHFPYSGASRKGLETANEAIEQFFLCLGNLIDPSYCTGVYNDLVPQLPDIDPCTIEDIQPFQDIMDLLNGIDEIYDPLDMNCGAGIVPALAEIETYNHAVLRLIDSILRPAQQTFISDIGSFKSIIMEPQPLAVADEEELARQEELLAFLQGPPPLPEPNPAANFFNNIIPQQAQDAFEGMGNIANNLAALGGEDQTSLVANIRALMASRVLLVAPDTRSLYENIENSFLTSGVVAAASPTPGITGLGPDEALKYYAFLTNLLLRGDGINTYGRVITYNINGGSERDLLNIYPNPAPALNPAADLVTDSAAVIEGRKLEALEFRNIILGYGANALGHNVETYPFLRNLFKKKFYPFVYFSLIESFATTIANSDLFDPVKLNNFNLLPKVCADGSISNLDLLDINKIKQEALEEFANNSCIEGDYELGPVRDAGLQALVSTYMQVIVVDLILKNIFMVSKFGVDYLSASPAVINELLNQATHRIVVYLGGEDALGESYNLPADVKTAAAIVVKKLIVRDPQGFAYPISGALTNQGQIDLLQNTPDFRTTVSVDNPILQTIAVKYLFEKRLQGTAEKVKEYFGIGGDSAVESYLANGISNVELADFQSLPEDWAVDINSYDQ
jgi:hypothetical protein